MLFLLAISRIFADSNQPPPVRSYDFVKHLDLQPVAKDHIELRLQVYNQTYLFDLTAHRQLLSPEAVVEIVSDNQTTVQPIHGGHVYKGTVYKSNGLDQLEVGWARLSVIDKLSYVAVDGSFTTLDGMYHIRDTEHYLLSKRDQDVEIASPLARPRDVRRSRTIVFKDQPSKRKRSESIGQCGNTWEHSQSLLAVEELGDLHLNKRAPVGCPTSIMVMPIGVAADCSYVTQKGGSDKALQQILTNINLASKLYESTFNIRLGVAKVLLQTQCSPSTLPWNRDCSDSYTISQRLSDFAGWRGSQGDDGNGLWHLMTKCSTQPSVGIAWLKTVCQTNAVSQGGSQVSGVGVSSIVPVEWKVVAHEIGHNFGAQHDCTSSSCPCSATDGTCSNCVPCSPNCDCKGQFMMHPLENSATDSFSPGTINQICTTTAGIRCLKDPSTFTAITSGVCGNGIKEGNEQCDCGLPGSCTDTCCDAATCKLKAGAVCADGNDSCCSQCRLRSNGTLCHPSAGVCDKTMYCDGVSVSCPLNSFFPDGQSCTTASGASAQCASGVCTSRDLQCRASGIVTTVSACPQFSTSCTLNCQDSRGQCYVLNGNFLDGTPCGGGGKCQQGSCQGSNFFLTAIEWIQLNPQIGYPTVAIVGLIILGCIWNCGKRCCKRKQEVRTQGRVASAPTNWVDPSVYNGPNYVPSDRPSSGSTRNSGRGYDAERPSSGSNRNSRSSARQYDQYPSNPQLQPSAPPELYPRQQRSTDQMDARSQRIVQVRPGVFTYE
ncbi:Metallo-peptidase family M12-domain-containing protein [Gorgonomyces haynaldii]|nr:Metallo-peptidase family M12-domain-containing protein [Gorgonomyces haynaldii]